MKIKEIIKKLMYIVRGKRLVTQGGGDPEPEVLPTPTFGTVTKTQTTFSQPLTNLPSGASVVWTFNSVVDTGQTGGTFSKTGLTANTAYSLTAKYTKSGSTDSSVASTSITTDASVGVTKADLNAYNTNAFYADAANVVGGGALVDGAIISGFPDALTDKVIPYAGQTTPSRGRPKYFEGTIPFYNEKEVYFYGYDSGQGWPAYTNPQEMTLVFRKMPGQDFEAMSIDNYIGEAGGQLRVGDQFGTIGANTASTSFEITIIHVRITASGSNRIWTVWKNGTQIGSYTCTSSRGSYAINVHTNAADHDFIAKFYKQGVMSDSDRTAYLEKLNTYFGAGSLPNKPYASNVGCTRSGSGNNTYTASYSYNGVNPQNVSAVEYQWYELINEGGFTQVKLAGTTQSIFYNGANAIRPEVKVTDNQGNTWRFVNYPGWVAR